MAAPAEPQLASSLYNSYLTTTDEKLEHSIEDVEPRKRQRVNTNCKAIDAALEPGFVHGEGGIVCISGDAGSGSRELSQHLLISHLLSHPSSSATIIDTLGTQDILGLYKIIIARVQKQRTAHLTTESQDIDHYATQLLDRVKVMRVFDFEGMLEGITELREELEARARSTESVPDLAPEEDLKVPKATIADSQASETEEMLLDVSPPATTTIDSPQIPPDELHTQPQAVTESEQPSHNLLMIDTLTAPLSPLLTSNYAQGQTLLTSSLRSLSHLTSTHNLLTLLLNTTVTYRNDSVEGVSVFDGIKAQPALGKTLGYCVDVSLLVSKVPRSVSDARTAFAGSQVGTQERRKGVKWVSVVEVLGDRYEDRVGRFGVFEVGADGMLRDTF